MNRVLWAVPWALAAVFSGALWLTWHELSAQVTQREAELASLREQHNQLVVEANRKLEEANNRYNALVEEANNKISVANQPEVEVKVSFRKALLHSGHVAAMHNDSNRAIAITCLISRPSSDAKKSYELTLDPGQTVEIGQAEGWAFISGDTIRIEQPAHKAITVSVP